jgi:hypothetical protein
MASTNIFHETDPRGDVVLVIQDPDKAFAEYDFAMGPMQPRNEAAGTGRNSKPLIVGRAWNVF